MELHQSTLNTVETCWKKYYFRYIEGLEEDSVNQTLLLGTAFHKGLEWYYQDYPNSNPLDFYQRLRRKYRQLEKDNLETLKGMLKTYGIYSRANDPQIIKEVVATEYHFEMPVVDPDKDKPTEDTLAGTVDLIFRDFDDNLVVVDHKTRGRLNDNIDYLQIDNQLLFYDYAISRDFDERVNRVIYNTVLKKTPSKPKVLKSGKLSKSKRVRSLPSIVIKAIKEHHEGQVPVEFKDLISSQFEKMDKKGNPFVERLEVEHTLRELINFEDELFLKVEEINNKEFFPQQPGKYKCKYCPYTQLCIADQKGTDIEFLKSITFSS